MIIFQEPQYILPATPEAGVRARIATHSTGVSIANAIFHNAIDLQPEFVIIPGLKWTFDTLRCTDLTGEYSIGLLSGIFILIGKPPRKRKKNEEKIRRLLI